MAYKVLELTAKAIALVLGVVILSAPARAADDEASASSGDSDTLQEIMVTAQKRSERLQDVPIAVEALTAAAIEASGIDTTKDLADLVPGLSFRETYNQLQPHLRGVGTEAAGPGSESPVGIYIDDVYYASAVATDMELNDISQVTVLKGPQGTLFGRNTTGGVIQVTTKDPTQDTQFNIGESFGSYRDSVTDMYLAGGLAKDLAASVTARYETQGEGWGRNLYTGNPNHKIDSDISVRGKVVYTPSSDVTLKIGADYSNRVDSMGPNFRPYSTSLISPGLLTVPYVASSNPWDTDANIDNHNHFHQDGVSANLDVNLGFAHWVNIAAWRQDNLSTQFSPTSTPTPGTNITISEQTHQFTEEMRLVSPSSDVFNWVGGLFFFDGHGDTDPLSLELYPNSTGAPFPINAVIVTTENTKSVAGYLQDTVRIFEDTHLTTGVRATWEQRTYSGAETDYAPFGLLGVTPSPDPPELTYTRPTWRVALDHKFREDLMGYISYDRGFKSGGYDMHGPSNPPYKPETIDAYEVGLKSEWDDRRFLLNLAGFYYDYRDVQVARYTQVQVIYNGATAEIYGLDLDFKAKIDNAWQVSGGIELLHNAYTNFRNADIASAAPGVGVTLAVGDATGNALPNAPAVTADISVDYLLEQRYGTFDFNVTDSYSSAFYQEADNFLSQPAYDLLNTSVTLNTSHGHWRFKLFGNNLLNKAVATQLSTNAITPPTPAGVPALISNVDYASPPRTYGVSVRYSY